MKEQTEEEELILGILGSLAERDRYDELPDILCGMVFAVAAITSTPNALIDQHIERVKQVRDQLVADGQIPGDDEISAASH